MNILISAGIGEQSDPKKKKKRNKHKYIRDKYSTFLY